MATYAKLGSGNWRVQVQRKRYYVSETFRRRKDAEEIAFGFRKSRQPIGNQFILVTQLGLVAIACLADAKCAAGAQIPKLRC